MFTALESNVDFYDSELISCSYVQRESTLTVNIERYDASIIEIVFFDVAAFKDLGTKDLTMFGELNGDYPFLSEILTVMYHDVPKDHPYRLFQFLDLDNEPSLHVVAVSYEVKIHLFTRDVPKNSKSTSA